MSIAKGMPTPILYTLKLSPKGDYDFEDPTLYRSIVGGLQYATITRLDISFSISKVCQFMHKPLVSDWKAVKHILRYLSSSIDQALMFYKCPDLRFLAFCDSN